MATQESVLTSTDFPKLKLLKRGKVRDVYDLGEHLLIVATDRLSAFDVILPQGIPYKGKVLTKISEWWFEQMQDIVKNHLVSTIVFDFPAECKPYWDALEDRSMLVRKAKPLPVECVVRGYLSGSGWAEYQESTSVCGIPLTQGLVESSKLDEPIFTPATKEEVGLHDINISFEKMVEIVGRELAEQMREIALLIFERGARIAVEKEIIIADTKMEFGLDENDHLMLIDELLTPDSSRFWPMGTYRPGTSQPSFDKQFVRDYLISINFNRKPPGPQLPEEIIHKTSALYLQALKRITGTELF
ncbi:MAG: phosphoribosylaminoimidazolesuccinocarboxamide synthase [Ignavibacteria bacterium]|nr:phosphoribosylaminoimidazolesuccinocarboxamide synthase [Ignavibacteria bacterium]